MAFTVVIPARYQSQRLPGKPLLDIAGKPMIRRVVERASASAAERVIVATDDERIVAAVEAFGGEVVMTDPDHPSGTDRLEEVCRRLALDDEAVVVNVQGDEPLIPPTVINQVAGLLSGSQDRMATLCEPVTSAEDFMDPNIVKVVIDDNGRALYFSRAPIPWPRDVEPPAPVPGMSFRHLGIYAYRAGLLKDYVTWPQAALENIEKLEQLRVLANGIAINIAVACESVPPGVDTQGDLERTIRYLESQS